MFDLSNLQIQETAQDLQRLFQQQSHALQEDRVAALLLTKLGRVSSIAELAQIIGRSPRTLCQWLHLYQAEGLDRFLSR